MDGKSSRARAVNKVEGGAKRCAKLGKMNDKNVIDLSFFTNSLIKASAVKTTNGRMFKGKKTHAKWEQVLRFLIVHLRPPAGDFFARGDEAGRIEVRAMKENSLVRPR